MLDTAAAHRVALEELSAVYARATQLTDVDWQRPTPCPDWDLERLVRHIAAVAWQQAEAFRRASVDALEPPSYLEVRTPRELLVGVLGRARDEIAESAARLMDDPDRTVPLPFAAMPAAFAMQALVVEYGFHRWDVDASLDGPDVARLSEEVADTHLETASFTLAATAASQAPDGHGFRLRGDRWDVSLVSRGGQWVAGDPEVAAVVEGDDAALALFSLGRRSLHDAGVTVTGDAALAESFTEFFPGLRG